MAQSYGRSGAAASTTDLEPHVTRALRNAPVIGEHLDEVQAPAAGLALGAPAHGAKAAAVIGHVHAHGVPPVDGDAHRHVRVGAVLDAVGDELGDQQLDIAEAVRRKRGRQTLYGLTRPSRRGGIARDVE